MKPKPKPKPKYNKNSLFLLYCIHEFQIPILDFSVSLFCKFIATIFAMHV